MGVLGHEWAHVTARHGTRGMTRTLKTLTAGVTVMLITQVWAEVTDDKVKKVVLPLIGVGTLAGAQLRLFYPDRKDYIVTSVGYEEAVLATTFVNGLQKQQEDAVSKYMEGFVGKMMTDKKPKS